MTTRKYTVTFAAALPVLAGLALAQDRKPLPPQPVQERYGTERLPYFGEFLDAYARAGSPRLLFVVTSDGADDTASTLAARLEDLFRSAEVTILNPPANMRRQSNARNALSRNDEDASARLAARDLEADVLVTVDIARRGRTITGSYVVTDMRAGTTIGSYAWDMLPDPYGGGFDNFRVSEYARAIGDRIAMQFAEAFPDGPGGGSLRRYTVNLTGEFDDEDLEFLRDALEDAAGVREGSVVLRDLEQSGGGQLVTVEFLSGADAVRTRSAISRAVAESLAMSTELLSSRGSQMTLRLMPLGLSRDERALAFGGTTDRNRDLRDRFARAYADAGSPGVLVMVNLAGPAPALAGGDANRGAIPAPVQQGDGTNIIIGERVGPGGWIDPIQGEFIREEIEERRADRIARREFDARALENRLIERFSALGLELRDAARAQQELRDGGELDRAWTDASLAEELGRRAGADIVISGVARVDRPRSGAPQRVEVTLRAVRVSDGTVLGSATASRDTRTGATLDGATDALAAWLTGRLANQLLSRWSDR